MIALMKRILSVSGPYQGRIKLAFVFAGIVLLVATLFSMVYRRMRDSGPAEQAGD